MMRYIISLALVFMTALPSVAANITTCGDISVAGTHVLQNDVSNDKTCFFISANDVTLDLNGHTITYDNAAPISIQNGSFESADMSGWDLTGASSATRAAGTYLGRTVYAGSYALKITAPLTEDQSVVTSASYTLLANTPYSASVMMWQPYAVTNANNADIYMTIEIIKASDNTVLAVRDSRELQSSFTSRGLQYVRALYTPTENTAVKIRLKVVGARTPVEQGQAPYGAFYFDDVRIQQTGNSGVQSGGTSLQYGYTNKMVQRVKIISSVPTKGKVIQGQAHGDFSHAVIAGSGVNNPNDFTIDNLEITVAGNSSHAILVGTMANGIISNNIIHSNVDTIEIRDHYDGATIYAGRDDVTAGTGGEIYNNVITHGIQSGIYVVGSPSATVRTKIYNNNITLQSKYTNDFAIVSLRNRGSNIYSNTIDCGSGSNSCRGIYMNADGGSIYDNIVDVQYLSNGQEYGGCDGSYPYSSNVWTYGIQIESATVNADVHGNTVTANANQCGAIAFRYYGNTSTADFNNKVYNNTFKAVVIGSSQKIASTVGLMQSYSQHLSFYENNLITNSNWLSLGQNIVTLSTRSLTLDNNTFTLDYPKATNYYPLTDETYADGVTNAPRNVTISNNVYADATVTTDMSTAQFRSYYLGFEVDPGAYNIVITESGESVNGTCGTSGGQSFTEAPTTGLCSVGTPSSVTGTGPWSWTCAGSGGGTTANCSATLASGPVVAPSKSPGRYTSSQSVTLTADGATAIKYCLTTGCTPTTTYTGAFKILQNVASQVLRTQADDGVITETAYKKQCRRSATCR